MDFGCGVTAGSDSPWVVAGVLLTHTDRTHFLAPMWRQTNSAVHRRVNALLLLDDGWSAERVGEALFIDDDTSSCRPGG